MRQRARNLGLFFALLFCLIAAFLGYRMLFQAERISGKRYVNTEVVQLMQTLIRKDIIVSRQDGIDLLEGKFRREDYSPRQLNLARRHLSGVTRSEGKLTFDPRSASVLNPALSSGKRSALRGRIVDREGNLLAGPSRETMRRKYPLGAAGFQLIGYGREIYASFGLEKRLDTYLHPGKQPWWRILWRGTGPPGSDVRLTLSKKVQKKAFDALSGRKGAVVALEPESGDILALASSPSFDPNMAPGKKWRELADEPGKPRANRAVRMRYPPGSMFKLVVASAALEKGMRPRMTCPKHYARLDISDRRRFGEMSLQNALAQSCNVYFARLGERMGKDLAAQAEAFGFNSAFHLLRDIPHSSWQTLPSVAFAWQDSNGNGQKIRPFDQKDFERNPKLVAQGAIGQNTVEATPLQMALVAATIANDGVLMRPRLVLQAGDATTEPQGHGRVLGKRTARDLKDMMTLVMEEGTGNRLSPLFTDGDGSYALEKKEGWRKVEAAGKSGTAEVKGDKAHAWFVSFAPARDPRVVVCAFLENGGWGSSNAGPVAMRVLADTLSAF